MDWIGEAQTKLAQTQLLLTQQRAKTALIYDFLPGAHPLETVDPVQPAGGYVSGQAVGLLSGEDSQGASVRAVHPRPL